MQRRALIADNAAGPQNGADAVLARFGFVRTAHVPYRADAFLRMQDERFDLVILPLQDITPGELLALEREMRRDSGVSVIGTAPAADTDMIIRAMRAGIHEFLVYPPSSEELAGSVDRLVRRSSEDVERGELIAVYSGKGGLGSTSVAVNLAHAFASHRTDARVALADLVVSGGDVRVFLNLKPAYDLSHLVAKGSQVDGELLNSILSPCPGGVWALPTGENPEPEEIFDAASIGSILDLLRLHFAVTVADCEHHLSERTLVALDSADTIILITHLSVASLRSTQRTLGLCRRLGYNENKLCVVVNRYQSADVLPIKDAQDLLKWPIYWQLPNDYRLSAASLTKGVPVAMEDPGSKLARSYQALAAKLGGTLGTPGGMGASRNGKPGSRIRQILGFERRVGNVT
ncbi:MAG: P-loop NTPase [Gemmatimonadota bacterium]|nr:P-loop NTPase [Gemmatimonadota bacterium]